MLAPRGDTPLTANGECCGAVKSADRRIGALFSTAPRTFCAFCWRAFCVRRKNSDVEGTYPGGGSKRTRARAATVERSRRTR